MIALFRAWRDASDNDPLKLFAKVYLLDTQAREMDEDIAHFTAFDKILENAEEGYTGWNGHDEVLQDWLDNPQNYPLT